MDRINKIVEFLLYSELEFSPVRESNTLLISKQFFIPIEMRVKIKFGY